jgi:hypothetical protein
MIRYLLWLGIGLTIAAMAPTGCGGGTTCESICSDWKSQNCGRVSGDCGIFCTSLDKLTVESGCQTQSTNYFVCVSEGDVCAEAANCPGQRNSLNTCIGAYCLGHLGDTDCQTVTAALK